MTEQESRRGKSRRERVEFARSRDILDVANELQMELVRSGRDYRWKEHDSLVISPDKNLWKWFSRNTGGDAISLVETIKEVDFNQSVDFLNDGNFKEFQLVERPQEDFKYYLEKYEQPLSAGRDYLRNQRGLSDETIDYFLEQGVLAQANAKLDYFAEGNGGNSTNAIEPVIVFKSLSSSGEVVGASLQGIQENWEKWPKHGYAKVIMKNSDPMTGIHVDIGSPKRLIFTESPIDLMSYYELHKDSLQDVRLVSMDGLKESTIGRHLSQIQAEISGKPLRWTPEQMADGLQVAIDHHFFEDGKNADLITLALDNDKAGRTFIQELEEKGAVINSDLPELRPGQDKTDWNDVLKNQQEEKSDSRKSEFEEKAEATLSESSPFPDTSHLSPEDATWLKENWNNIGFSVEPRKQMVIDSDKTVTYEEPSNPLGDGREPKKQIQSTEKAPENSQEQMNDRTSGGTGSLQPKAEGSTSPVLETSTFEQTVTSHPTSSYPYLQFSTNYDKVQRRIANYHPITPADLRRLNQYAPSIQSTAFWYLNELADSKISFVYADHGEENVLQVTFQKDNFIHLSGIRPFKEGKGAANFLDDIANGQGHYDGMLISNAIKDKLQVLPMLRDILDPHSFVLDDLSSVEKLHNLNMSEAIKAKDEDFLLLFKDIGDEKIPASLMKLKGELATNVKSLDEKIILGVYREQDGHIEQLSINEEYVKDKGAEMLSVLKNKQYEEVSKEIEQTTLENTLNSPLLDSATFTQVLDTVYNLGVPGDISKTPEEFHQAWNQYLDYAKQYNDKFDQIVAAAGEDHLLDTNSDFYKEWKQDHIYKENYHVRLQWSEERPDGPKLPFKETELISYQEFARELYKANQSFYQLHQEGLKQVTGDHPEAYISPTKLQFSIYAPDGELIQDGIRYNIGEEINPIAHKERLGTREMREHPELMKIDGAIFTQYHLERLASELDLSQLSYALEDTLYADQLLSQLPFGDLENSPIGFTDSSHDARLGFISFDGMDSVEVENLSAWFEKLGVKDSPMEQVALVEKWQKEIKSLSEKVEQTIATVREEFEKSQVKDSQNTLDNPYEKIYQYNRKDERDRDLDGDGISNSDEMLQGTDPYNAASNLHKKQEDRERSADVEVIAGAIITDAIATKSSEQTISQLVANKDTKALAEHLKEGMKNYLDSEQFKSFLDTMSKFHNYSLNNIHLLKMQNPNVSRVASFNKWKADFDRTVKKGSKALKIWVPYQVKTKISANQNELSFSPSENEMEEKEVTVTRFKLGNVFDVSQTEGKELPKAINELTGDVKDYEDLYRAAKAVSMDNQVPISFEEIKRESANGYYSPDENRIVISKGLKGQEQILKTIFHEMAHADLHRGTNAQYGDDQYRKQELQAESVAYVVANHFGFDTSSYSFGYLAIWAKDKNGFEDMVEQLQVVQKEAKSLIDRMDAKLELVKNKTVTKDKFADKLQQAKEKSEQLGNQKVEAVKQVEEKKSLSNPR